MRKRLQALIQSMHIRSKSPCLELVTIVDLQGIAHYISDEHQIIVGYNPDELVNQCLFEYVHPYDLPYVCRRFNRLKQTRMRTTAELRFLHKQGGYVDLRAESVPLPPNEYLSGFVTVCREVVDLSALVKKLANQATLQTN